MPGEHDLLGLLAEFETPERLVRAVERVRAEGYRHIDAYTPHPIHEMAEAMGFRRGRLPLIVLIGGIVGALTGYFMQYYALVIGYPLNIGGRPHHSWPVFIPITFEMTILFAAFAAVFGMLGLNGLPRPHHPLFAIQRFNHATQDAFFLSIDSRDEKFDPARTARFLAELGSVGIWPIYY